MWAKGGVKRSEWGEENELNAKAENGKLVSLARGKFASSTRVTLASLDSHRIKTSQALDCDS